MADQKSVGELRQSLTANKARWSVDPNLKATDLLPLHRTGGQAQTLPLAARTPAVNLAAILSAPPINPLLNSRRIANGLLKNPPLLHSNLALVGSHPTVAGAAAAPTPSGGSGHAGSVDWRDRWGWPWITSVQDQIGENCWAMAATALVEAMLRINHAVFSKRAEGDVHDGMGSLCSQGGSAEAAVDWIAQHGLCDKESYEGQCALPYHSTSDRNGRTTKIGGKTLIGDMNQQKAWIDAVGPMITWFDVWHDFDGYHSGVYHWQSMIGSTPNYERGGHFMLVVGYDDAQGCWICKNSWGAAWGDHGYVRVAYGDDKSGIDRYAKIGLHDTNASPLAKRRLHNGAMIESGNGALHRNFEMMATAGPALHHWWRDGGDFSWHSGLTFGNDAAACPTVIGTTYNRNFESVHLTGNHRLHHWFFDQAGGQWRDGGVFGPTNAAGIPGFIQGNYGMPGNFEVVVRTSDGRLNHWWRMNGPPWTWSDGGHFGSGIAYSGPSLLQSHFGTQGNFELVAVTADGHMKHFWRDNDHGLVWRDGVTFGDGIHSPPCMIEGQYGAADETRPGNFELCVARGDQVEHWWHDNQGNAGWQKSATFGHNVMAVAALVEGSYGFNLELIVLRTDQQLQHYWRDGGGWHDGPIIGHV